MSAAFVSSKDGILFIKSRETGFEEIFLTIGKLHYENLIKPIETRMMRSIWRIVRHTEAAEDTMQDALTIIWRRLDRIHRHPNPQALILKICINAAYDTLRKQKRYRNSEAGENYGKHPDRTDMPVSEKLEKKEMEDEILKAISRLPRKQALAVFLRVVQEQPYEQIAQILGCTETTVRIQVSKGRTKLNRSLAHLNPSSFKKVKE